MPAVCSPCCCFRVQPRKGDVFTLALYNPMEYKFQFTALRAGRGSLLQLEGGNRFEFLVALLQAGADKPSRTQGATTPWGTTGEVCKGLEQLS